MAENTGRRKAELARYSSELYAEFSRMTVKQLRTYANQNHIKLGDESTKAAIIQKMVGQLRHLRLLGMGETL